MFSSNGGNFLLNGVAVETPNVYSAKSIIHQMNGCVPYNLNVWEFITQGEGHDLMKAYINSHTVIINSNTSTNDVLNQLSFTNQEDTISSVIIPTDAAWNDAYAKLYPYCASPNNGQDESTKSAIIHNNFFLKDN